MQIFLEVNETCQFLVSNQMCRFKVLCIVAKQLQDENRWRGQYSETRCRY